MAKQYVVYGMYTAHAYKTTGETVRETTMVYDYPYRAESKVRFLNANQTTKHGVGKENIFFYYVEENKPEPKRHWIRYDPNDFTITSGVDFHAAGFNGTTWAGGNGATYAAGESYAKALRVLADYLEKENTNG